MKNNPLRKLFIATKSGLNSSQAEIVAQKFLKAHNKKIQVKEKQQARRKAEQKQARLERELAKERRKALIQFIIKEVSEVNDAEIKISIANSIAIRNGMSPEEASKIAKQFFKIFKTRESIMYRLSLSQSAQSWCYRLIQFHQKVTHQLRQL